MGEKPASSPGRRTLGDVSRGRLLEMLVAFLLPLILGALAMRVYVDQTREIRERMTHQQEMRWEDLDRLVQDAGQ